MQSADLDNNCPDETTDSVHACTSSAAIRHCRLYRISIHLLQGATSPRCIIAIAGHLQVAALRALSGRDLVHETGSDETMSHDQITKLGTCTCNLCPEPHWILKALGVTHHDIQQNPLAEALGANMVHQYQHTSRVYLLYKISPKLICG